MYYIHIYTYLHISIILYDYIVSYIHIYPHLCASSRRWPKRPCRAAPGHDLTAENGGWKSMVSSLWLTYKKAIKAYKGHRNCWFTHNKLVIETIVMLVYQRLSTYLYTYIYIYIYIIYIVYDFMMCLYMRWLRIDHPRSLFLSTASAW